MAFLVCLIAIKQTILYNNRNIIMQGDYKLWEH
ncbi:hypothetical protein DESHY_40149 [Desulforamulus hydrothermalis Lam5 = DSM 18033]|uniref:Uncharacterized protein n=1 Tax=Desulforamulus hydrothermalis Lam5 = DSM 18033 TaxID=1121428 RepID=K8DZP5_9FIRM|nr:hypothetical protein DESHY_40149 [Desulforamulus hydrothermalis Lam5 = DSM 18033]